MGLRYYANAPATTLASSCGISDTAIIVSSVAGLPIQYPFTLILDRGESTEEVVSCTAAAGTTLSVVRGYDGTAAFAHGIGTEVLAGISAQDPREANAHINASGGVHGIGGSVVGTSDTQTLTNKTLGLSNTINGFTPSRLLETDGTGRVVSGSKTIPSGAVVGTTDAQTLTNKTLTAPVMTGGSWTNPPANVGLPPGVMVEYGGSIAPSGWLLCDGSAVSRTTYAALFSVIGTAHGAGDGSTTFNLPDRRDRMGVGASGTKSLGSTGGSATKDLSHTHVVANHTHGHTIGVANTTLGTFNGYQPFGQATAVNQTVHNHGITGGINLGGPGATAVGGSSTQDVMNPYVALNYLIKT